MKKEKPESDGCYEIGLSTEGKQCPSLNDTRALKPKCMKYGKELSWNVSGKIMKCQECLAGK